MTLQSDLEAAIADVQTNSQKLKGIVNGPASGTGSMVITDSGNVKTAAKAIADLEELFVANDVLNQSIAARDAAQEAQAAAEIARNDAQAASDLIKVSKSDTSIGSLELKLLSSGLVGLSTQNSGSNETRTIDVPVASQIQAEAGSDNDMAMTPLRVAQAIATLSPRLPPGCIITSASGNVPNGYLYCNGGTISRTVYADLFTAIGTNFGEGDGTNTFNIPDLRGEFLRGWDNGRGVDSGRGFGTAQSDNVGAHSHSVHAGDRAGWTSNYFGVGSPQTINTGGTTYNNPTGETRSRNVAVNFYIKY